LTGLVVVDSSAIGPMLLWDEADDLIPRLPDCFEEDRVLVPAHWHIEVASMMMNAVKRKRLDRAEAGRAMRSFARITVAIDGESSTRAWTDVTELAWTHGLTVYDAAYLELARRAGAALATGDSDLRNAALHEQVQLFA
jgi:predicted nucleic acid-binding protein